MTKIVDFLLIVCTHGNFYKLHCQIAQVHRNDVIQMTNSDQKFMVSERIWLAASISKLLLRKLIYRTNMLDFVISSEHLTDDTTNDTVI